MYKIPEKLCLKDFKFILVASRDKKPIEIDWPRTKNYQYSDEKIKKQLDDDGNLGIVCGYGGLIVLDFDDEKLYQDKKHLLPETFTVKSGSGGKHLYYYCNVVESWFINNKQKERLVDIQGEGKQVLIPPSTHPNGNRYTIHRDIPIHTIQFEEILAIFWDYLDDKNKKNSEIKQGIKNKPKLIETLKKFGVNTNHNPTNCILGHRSKRGKCFSFNDEKWYCFHCDRGGDVIRFIEEKEGVDFKEACSILNITLPKKLQKEEKDKIKIKEKSFLNTPQHIVDQIYDKETDTTQYIIYDKQNKMFSKNRIFIHNDKTYAPIYGAELEKGAVILPKDIKKYESIAALDKQVYNFLYKYLDVDDTYRKYAVLCIRRSWVYEKFNNLTYLSAIGDSGTGKSRFLESIGIIHYKPMMTMGSLNPAPIFRIINKWSGTLIVDEADQQANNKGQVTDEANAIIKILNAGFEKNRPVIRCNQKDANILEFFDVFCPKVISRRQRFYDKALESRCFTHIMKVTARLDLPDTLTQSFFDEAEDIRQQLLYYRLTNFDIVDPEASVNIDLSQFDPRLRQLNRQFMGMFIEDKQQIKEFKKFLGEVQANLVEERSETFEGRIIDIMMSLIILGDKNITASKIRAEYPNNDRVYEASIGRKLKELGFEVHLVKVPQHKKVMKVIKLDPYVFNQVIPRYCPDDDKIVEFFNVFVTVSNNTLKSEAHEFSTKNDGKLTSALSIKKDEDLVLGSRFGNGGNCKDSTVTDYRYLTEPISGPSGMHLDGGPEVGNGSNGTTYASDKNKKEIGENEGRCPMKDVYRSTVTLQEETPEIHFPKVTVESTGVTTVTDTESSNGGNGRPLDDREYISIIESAGSDGYDAIDFDDKYPGISSRLLSSGQIYEPKRGRYFVLK